MHLLRSAAPVLATLLLTGCAAAQTAVGPAQQRSASTAPGGPCAFVPIDVDRYGKQPFRNPPEIRAEDGVLRTELRVEYTDPATTSIAGCPVKLRSYNGALVGPTLRARPGDVLAPHLDNRLPAESEAEVHQQFLQEDTAGFLDMRPYSFNTTNLHTHGLHVSPSGNSDNVLLAIPPQNHLQYDIRLPEDHTRGTYWYHAHAHGSTAIQAGSAMAGALVVDDDPATTPEALRAASADGREKVFVIQTVLYDTAGESETLAAFFPDSPQTREACARGESTCTWQASNRRVTVNGQIVPVIRMRPGEVQRWRILDGSFRETMGIRLEGHALHEIATDGIYTGRIDSWPDGADLVLYPGYRSDVLVQAGRPGTYRMLDDSASTGVSLRGVDEDPNVIAMVVVEGEPMEMRLPTAAEMARMAPPLTREDLSREAVRVQEAVFKLGSAADSTDSRNSFFVNYEAFDESRVRYLQLDSVDAWVLSTVGDPAGIGGIPPLPHVFHIHINPFQVNRTGPDGRQQTVWKDTHIVAPGQPVTMWTRYIDFTGKFVIHCHILDHEDLGMMAAVEVVREMPRPHPRPDGTPDAAAGGHGSH